MTRRATRSQRQYHAQIPQRQRFRLEDRLEEGNVDERKLDGEGDRDGEEEHLVDGSGEEGYVQSSILERGDQIQHDE